jgi:ketosteroid isomerase-like protein
MTADWMRGFVHAFRAALEKGDLRALETMLADDVEWTVFGPIDLFPFFGQRQGKAAVLAMCADIGARLRLRRCEHETTLVDGDNAASLMTLGAVQAGTGRMLTFRLAQFARFRDGKLIALKAVFDTFDAVEQALGREIDLSAVA